MDFAVPANDDATKSIAIITNYITAAIMEGLQERSQAKENGEEDANEEEATASRGLEINEEDDKNERRGGGAGRGRGPNAGSGGRSRTGAPRGGRA
ncbi:MAG: hypothetical protein QM743_05170 [Chitinophagaceae bacterium]